MRASLPRHAGCRDAVIGAALLVACGLSACGSSRHHAPRTEQQTASAFAGAYVRFLDGQGSADTLPHATAAVRGQAASGGRLPAADRVGQLLLVGFKNSGPQQLILSARNNKGTLYAQETLAVSRRQGWQVTSLMTPDFEQAFTKSSTATAPQPAGSAAARQAARTFLAGFLPYYYGRAKAKTISAATPSLVKELAAHPPNVPPTTTQLHPSIGAIGMQKTRGGWLALAEIVDGQENYQLNLSISEINGQWLVTKETSS